MLVLVSLCENFPAAFRTRPEDIKPLKLRIHSDIQERMEVKSGPLRLALYRYTASEAYLRCCKQGTPRIDLEGADAGEITEQEAQFAAEKLEALLEKRSKPRGRPRGGGGGGPRGGGERRGPPRS